MSRGRLLAWIVLAFVASGAAIRAEEPSPATVALVLRTPRGGFNRMVVTLRVCAPGTDRCATIDDVLLDTGSVGLRLEADALPAWLAPPTLTDEAGRPLAECLLFTHDSAWGPLVRVDLTLGGLVANDMPMQIVGEEAWPDPALCPRSGGHPTANGTLGLGLFASDCPGRCLQSLDRPLTYRCEAGSCAPVVGIVPEAWRLPNPLARFPGHGEGIVVHLDGLPDEGAPEGRGSLTLGLSACGGCADWPLVRTDEGGRFTTILAGKALPGSTIDSGSPAILIADPTLPRCRELDWAYCAVPPLALAAELVGIDGARLRQRLVVGDAKDFYARRFGASGTMVETAPPQSGAVWGAPFFVGRTIALVREGQPIPGRPGLIGPAYAIAP